jgi:hypothetical protein
MAESNPINKTAVAITGIAGLVILEGIALYQGVNGTMLSMVVMTIAGVVGGAVGFKIKDIFFK